MISEDSDQALVDAQNRQALQRQTERDDLVWLMGGRRVLTRVLERAGVNRTSFNSDSSVMAFSEGRRDMGLWLQAELIDASFDGYLHTLTEFAERK